MTGLKPQRIAGIDILRGLVMIIMALDHTRDFFHITAMTGDPLDPATTTPALFFTRWITHFCAPVFVFLSGVSVYLSSLKKTPRQASSFVIKRGLWLVVVEVTLVTFGITFNPFFSVVILQVIWAIGWSMVLLGLLMRLGYKAVLITGVILFFGHNLVDYIQFPQTGAMSIVWAVLIKTNGSIVPIGSSHVVGIFYTILPWTGIMLLGYCIGIWYHATYTAEQRKRNLLITGSLLTIGYLALRLAGGYGDPGIWQASPHPIYSLLNTSKYPPSLQYAGMTLGPSLILLALIDQAQARWSKVVSVYGRVPFFYYILHFYILHLILVAVFFANGNPTSKILDPNSFMAFRSLYFGFQLPIVYLLWMFVVVVLYLPCKWFHSYKTTHQQWWLKYL